MQQEGRKVLILIIVLIFWYNCLFLPLLKIHSQTFISDILHSLVESRSGSTTPHTSPQVQSDPDLLCAQSGPDASLQGGAKTDSEPS